MTFSPEDFNNGGNEIPSENEEALTEVEQDYRIQTPEVKREEVTAKLKENASDLLDISKHLIDGQNVGWAQDKQVDAAGETLLKPFNWNENSGVLLFNDGEKTYVTRATDELRDMLHESGSGYTKESGLGVPHVNNPDVWKSSYEWDAFSENW